MARCRGARACGRARAGGSPSRTKSFIICRHGQRGKDRNVWSEGVNGASEPLLRAAWTVSLRVLTRGRAAAAAQNPREEGRAHARGYQAGAGPAERRGRPPSHRSLGVRCDRHGGIRTRLVPETIQRPIDLRERPRPPSAPPPPSPPPSAFASHRRPHRTGASAKPRLDGFDSAEM